jgi:hypothetical protein
MCGIHFNFSRLKQYIESLKGKAEKLNRFLSGVLSVFTLSYRKENIQLIDWLWNKGQRLTYQIIIEVLRL